MQATSGDGILFVEGFASAFPDYSEIMSRILQQSFTKKGRLLRALLSIRTKAREEAPPITSVEQAIELIYHLSVPLTD